MNSTLRLGATQSLIDALDEARSVQLDSYVLANPRLIDALERAAKRGAKVQVDMCGDPAGDKRISRENTKTIQELQKHGVDVRLRLGEGPDSLHAKAALIDGHLFLDDRNWTESAWETVIRDDRPADVAAWRNSVSNSHFAQRKQDALKLEHDLILHSAGKHLVISTESLGPGPILDAVIARAEQGADVRLLFDDKLHVRGDTDTLRRLREAGVHVRTTDAARKMACVGDAAWIGSANATRGGPEWDWGMIVKGELAQRLDAVAERTWDAAHPLMYRHP